VPPVVFLPPSIHLVQNNEQHLFCSTGLAGQSFRAVLHTLYNNALPACLCEQQQKCQWSASHLALAAYMLAWCDMWDIQVVSARLLPLMLTHLSVRTCIPLLCVLPSVTKFEELKSSTFHIVAQNFQSIVAGRECMDGKDIFQLHEANSGASVIAALDSKLRSIGEWEFEWVAPEDWLELIQRNDIHVRPKFTLDHG
jgi:hypothetical protein